MTKIFNHQAYGLWWPKFFGCQNTNDQNLFSVTNCNEGNPSVNKDFFASILMDMMPDAKWACCVGFENPM
jgi:hypothetical protein